MEGEPLDSPSVTFGQYCDEMCSYYMAIGVPEKEYWYGDPSHLKYYVKAHELKNQQKNEELWLQGLYIYNAISVVMHNAFSKKGTQPEKYLEKPIQIKPSSETEKKKSAEKERQKIIADLTAWGKAWESRVK